MTNNQIWEKLDKIESKIDSLYRFNHSNKFNLLKEQVKLRKRMDTTAVMALCGVSRPWTLHLMKKLGKEVHFRFIDGDKTVKRPSLILYSEEQAMRSRYKEIKDLVDKNKEITFAKICSELKLSLGRDLGLVKSLVDDLVKKEKGYYIKEENKLCKEL